MYDNAWCLQCSSMNESRHRSMRFTWQMENPYQKIFPYMSRNVGQSLVVANKKEWHIKIVFSILLKSLKFREINLAAKNRHPPVKRALRVPHLRHHGVSSIMDLRKSSGGVSSSSSPAESLSSTEVEGRRSSRNLLSSS